MMSRRRRKFRIRRGLLSSMLIFCGALMIMTLGAVTIKYKATKVKLYDLQRAASSIIRLDSNMFVSMSHQGTGFVIRGLDSLLICAEKDIPVSMHLDSLCYCTFSSLEQSIIDYKSREDSREFDIVIVCRNTMFSDDHLNDKWCSSLADQIICGVEESGIELNKYCNLYPAGEVGEKAIILKVIYR